MKKIHYYEAIKQALKISLKKIKKVLLIGLGLMILKEFLGQH